MYNVLKIKMGVKLHIAFGRHGRPKGAFWGPKNSIFFKSGYKNATLLGGTRKPRESYYKQLPSAWYICFCCQKYCFWVPFVSISASSVNKINTLSPTRTDLSNLSHFKYFALMSSKFRGLFLLFRRAQRKKSGGVRSGVLGEKPPGEKSPFSNLN